MFQIICKDNYAREWRSDRVVAVDIPNAHEAKVMAEALNAKFGGDDFYCVEPMDYKPYVFTP